MRALICADDGVRVADIAQPEARGETIVRVVPNGICNTDIEIGRGYAGFRGTLGHELVGVVEASDDGAKIGARVVGEINAGCGTCSLCLAGDPRHCATRTVLGIIGRDGAHAERVRLPARNLLHVPETIADRRPLRLRRRAHALALLEANAVDVEPLITDVLPLARGEEAMARAQVAGVLKVLLDATS